MKKVYILGESRGAYRTQNLIKYFLDRQGQYKLYYNSYNIKNPVVRYLKSLLLNWTIIVRTDIIYVSTLNVDINIFWELLLGKILRKKIIIDYYVSVYDTVVLDRKWFKKTSLLAKVAIYMDRFFLKVGTKIIFLNQTEKKRYCELASIDSNAEKYRIVPLCVEKMGTVNSKFVYEEKEKLDICWWGSYLPLHGLDNIINAAKKLKEKGYFITWYFFGNSQKKGAPYEKMAIDLGLEKECIFINDYTFKNGKLMKFLIENCDLALGNFGTSEKSKNVLINKILDASAMQVNLVTCYSQAVMEFFNENQDIFMCDSTADGIVEIVQTIYTTDKKLLKQRIEHAYNIYENVFSVNSFLNKMEIELLGMEE